VEVLDLHESDFHIEFSLTSLTSHLQPDFRIILIEVLFQRCVDLLELFSQSRIGFVGFQTVTYMLEGKFKHEDNHGHRGEIGPGDLQWMTAGRGVMYVPILAFVSFLTTLCYP
jgi:hypothetical protein